MQAVRTLIRLATIATALAASSALAQAQAPAATDGPPPPVPPAVVTRDEAGHATVRAIALAEPLRLDGRLDESVYQEEAVSDFIQQVPKEGAPASERTETWVMFDRENIYISARCWDSAPPERWVANEMRRDTNQLRQNDTFGVILDTFHDRRNGFLFYTNPLGARADQAVTDEGVLNVDWNPVWDVRTGRFDGGWTVEMAIPFKSLRYHSGAAQVWGINIRRVIRRRNEWTHLTPIPASAGVPGGMFRISRAGTLVGLDLPPASKNVELKPYAISRLTTDRAATPVVSNDPHGDAGIDAKYSVTANLTADVTVNTDFAQVEVDEQQVNLTRFSLVFPEKREFFLEGRGFFDFGAGSGGVTTGVGGGIAPSLFYSRRIGLNRSRVVPIDVGGRLTGKVGPFGLGLLNIRTRAEDKDELAGAAPATDFTVLRIKRDVFRRSSVGAMFTNRSNSTITGGSNQAVGLDAGFSFFQDINIGGYVARSQTTGLKGDDSSYQGIFNYGADRYGLTLDHLYVGDNFNPEVGLVRRDNFRRTAATARFSPRPKSIKWARRFTWQGGVDYLLNGAGALETRNQTGRFNIELENSDQFSVDAARSYELLVLPFRINGVVVPPGGYTFSDVQLTYALGLQRRKSAAVAVQYGHYYSGTLTSLNINRARVSFGNQLSLEPSLSINWARLPQGDFTTKLLRTRADYAFSPRMFATALVQYSASDHVFSSNLRMRWEYHPGSELFVVYTDERDTLKPGYPDLKNRAFVVKINRLFRF
jgi:hypothetical protein